MLTDEVNRSRIGGDGMRRRYPPGTYMRLSSPEALKAYLKHRGLSYAELGQCAGVSKQFIGQLASGQKMTCKPETALRIEKVLMGPPERRSPTELPLFVQRNSDKNGAHSENVGPEL